MPAPTPEQSRAELAVAIHRDNYRDAKRRGWVLKGPGAVEPVRGRGAAAPGAREGRRPAEVRALTRE